MIELSAYVLWYMITGYFFTVLTICVGARNGVKTGPKDIRMLVLVSLLWPVGVYFVIDQKIKERKNR